MLETPEQKARRQIDTKLFGSGWLVQDRDDIDLAAGRGVAVREFSVKSGFGFAAYLLYLDRKAVGAVEAKAEGTLTGVEAQCAKYAADHRFNTNSCSIQILTSDDVAENAGRLYANIYSRPRYPHSESPAK
jgi:type I site-specific restriction endonuclease